MVSPVAPIAPRYEDPLRDPLEGLLEEEADPGAEKSSSVLVLELRMLSALELCLFRVSKYQVSDDKYILTLTSSLLSLQKNFDS